MPNVRYYCEIIEKDWPDSDESRDLGIIVGIIGEYCLVATDQSIIVKLLAKIDLAATDQGIGE